MAYIVVTYIVVAHTVMTYTVMTYIVVREVCDRSKELSAVHDFIIGLGSSQKDQAKRQASSGGEQA